MATNKNKDAAALFELIDRSTLKVPKNAGALKIPSWWSSKTNPPGQPSAPSSPPAATSAAASTTTPKPMPQARVAPAAAPAPKPAAEPPAEPAPQQRLFAPAPANVAPASTPSIRPPSARPPAPITTPVKVPAPVSYRDTDPISEKDLPPEVPDADAAIAAGTGKPAPRTKVFAPQTYAQDRKPWSAPRPGSFARLPAWMLVAGIVGIVLVAWIVVAIAKRVNTTVPSASQPTAAASRNAGPPASRGGILPPPMTGTGQTQTARGATTVPTPPQAEPGGVGKLYSPLSFPYDGKSFYVIVCQTPSQTIVERNAGWLREKGIDVAIEPSPARAGWFMLVAVQGSPSATAAEPFRQQIVKIGDSHIKDAWKTAYVTPISHKSATATAPR